MSICLKNILKLGNVHRFVGFQNHHLPTSYIKQTFLDVWSAMPERMDKVSGNRFRTPFDVSQSVFRYWQLVSGRFYPVSPTSRGERLCISDRFDQVEAVLKDPTVKMVCLNDTPDDVDFEQTMMYLRSRRR